MMDQRIQLLNQAAREVYNPTNSERQREADQTFQRLAEDFNNLGLILEFLERGEQPHAGIIASTTLKQLTERKISIPVSEQLRLSNQLLGFLASNASSVDQFVITKLSEVYANLCKFNFHYKDTEKQFPFRLSLVEVQNALTSMDSQGILALNLLHAVIGAFDEQKPSESNTEHRIAHNEFQNKFLRDFNNISIDQFTVIADMMKKPGAQIPFNYLKVLLSFYKKLLEYEFLGSSFDVEERETVDIPASWRIKTMSIYEPIFEVYRFLPATELNCLKEVLAIGGSIASVRRTLYDSEERSKIISALLNGIAIVLNDVIKLGIPEVFVEFSRFLYRVNRNFTFSDLAKHEIFNSTLLPLLSQFSCQAFKAFDSTASNGIFYLLAFWQRIAIHAPAPTKENEWSDDIMNSIKAIPAAFVQSRMQLCDLSSVGEADSPFDDAISIAQYMDHFAGLCRIDMMSMRFMLNEIFNQNTSLLSANEPGSQQYLLAELKLIFWTYIVGACLDTKETVRASFDDENPDDFDIDLFVNVTILSKFNLERLQHLGNHEVPDNVIQLEIAILGAYEKFRMAYLNETHRYYQDIQRRLVERMCLEIETEALWELYMEKIAKNIQAWGAVDEVISRTLSLFNSISTSVTICRKMWNLRTTQYMLSNHDGNTFPFLNSGMKQMLRNRSGFYSSLMRIVITGIEANELFIEDFMKPIQVRTDDIAAALERSNVDENQLKIAVMGLARDYRGLFEASIRIQPFAWISGYAQDKIYKIFLLSIQRFANDANVVLSILKFIAEATINRNARMAFNLKVIFHVFRRYAEYAEKYTKPTNAFNDLIFELGRTYPIFATKMSLDDLVVVFHYLEMGIHAHERSKLMNSCTTFERLTDLVLEINNRRKRFENIHTEPMGESLTRCFEQHPQVLDNFFIYFMNMIVSDSRPLHYMAGRVMFNAMYLRPQIYSSWKEEYGNQVSADIIQAVEDILKNFTDKPFSAEDREIFTVKIEQLQQQLKDMHKYGPANHTHSNSMDQ
ncbi:hypothetical protein FO519_008440 [Halicephalobus sp. NKZ332]|nr:hypothetical protein FO519_008440 [Halicephalobus sp. NKZ332]